MRGEQKTSRSADDGRGAISRGNAGLNILTIRVEVKGGRVPTSDWMLNLQILTSGRFH